MSEKKSKVLGICLFVFLIAFTSLSGCIGNDEDNTVIVTDMLGREVEVPNNVEKVVGVGVGALRFITYLDGSERVVGAETPLLNDSNVKGKTFLMAHPEYDDLPSIGFVHGGDPALIEKVEPQVIFKTTEEMGDCQVLQDDIGIPVIGLEGYCTWDESPDLGDNIDKFKAQIRLVGQVLGTEERGEELITFLEEMISDLHERTSDIPISEIPSVYVGGIPSMNQSSKINAFSIHQMLDFIGVKNVITPEMVNGSNEGLISRDLVFDLDPDIMFLYLKGAGSCQMNLSDVFSTGDNPWINISASRNDSLYSVMNHKKYGINFDTILANCYWAGKTIYPDRFSDVDPVQKANEIYSLWVGSPMYGNMTSSKGNAGFIKIDINAEDV